MYQTAAPLKHLSYYTRLTKAFHSDLQWWHLFVICWNRVSFFDCSLPIHKIHTDASGSWGCGAVFGTQWMQLAWSNEWVQMDIMAKELVSIVLSCAVRGPILAGHGVEFKCDNQGVVDSNRKESSNVPVAMHLLQCL